MYTLEELMQNYGNDVLWTALLYVRQKETAEDIFQEVFIKVHKKLNSFRGDSNIKTWLIRITINTCKDYLKSAWNKRVTSLEDYQQTNLTAEDHSQSMEEKELNQLVRKAVVDLPEKYKDMIVCVYFQELTIKDTAKLLHIPEGTAKSRLARAKELLGEKLKEANIHEFE